ncbi:Uncharacterised protein g2105 [Pycnogonum litorale]
MVKVGDLRAEEVSSEDVITELPRRLRIKVRFLQATGLFPLSLSKKNKISPCIGVTIFFVVICIGHLSIAVRDISHETVNSSNFITFAQNVVFLVVDVVFVFRYGWTMAKQKTLLKYFKKLLSPAYITVEHSAEVNSEYKLVICFLLSVILIIVNGAVFVVTSAGWFSGNIQEIIYDSVKFTFVIFYNTFPIVLLVWISSVTQEVILILKSLRNSNDEYFNIPNYFNVITFSMDLANTFIINESSLVLLLTIMSIFINILLSTNVLLTKTSFILIIQIAVDLFAMYLLSNEGQHLEEESNNLRDALLKTLLDGKVDNKEVRRKVKLLANRLTISPLSLNCYGFFKINRPFFLSTVGIIGSYAVVLITLN